MEWSVSKLSTLRQCHRKFYFAYELANFHFTHPIRRKAFELAQSKNLKMWQGTLIDNAFSKKIISFYKQKQQPDYAALSEEVVELAKRQFAFSESQLYRDKSILKKEVGEDFQILDVHECGVPYSQENLEIVYSVVRKIILQIPNYKSPEEGKTLHEYLAESNYLQPNIQYWNFEFEGVKLNPQIDLVRYKNRSVHVIDWKVSESNTSDYSKQLTIAGIVSYHNIKKDRIAKNWDVPKIDDFSLYEFNLMNGNFHLHPFNKETTAATLDYVFIHSEEQEQLSHQKKWNELDIRDYETTDKKETCAFCKFRPLCIHLISNNFIYNEDEYYKLVSDKQLGKF
jgi:hypothetical protein